MILEEPPLIVILAAGKGTRMKSELPKVLHRIAGRSMLGHVLDLSLQLQSSQIAVVVGPNMQNVVEEAKSIVPNVKIYEQKFQLGTANALLSAEESLLINRGPLLVLYADTPLIKVETLNSLFASLKNREGASVLGFEAKDPTGYGRLLLDDNITLRAIREHKDASTEELKTTLCNSGVMAFNLSNFIEILKSIKNSNAKGEYYLTDTVEMIRQRGLKSLVVRCREEEVLGVNSRSQLALAEKIWQHRARQSAMENGVTLRDPETVWFNFDTKLGTNVTIEQNVIFGPNVLVDDNVHIQSFCHLEGSEVGKSSRIGPFARLRPGTKLEKEVHIGNFVEVKNVVIGEGSKANHLSYLGDGTIGVEVNIGAGTIFCNYDGFFKYKTTIGTGAFIGSNSSLVAPVSVGEGAYIGSGSVITKDVPAQSLALERSGQIDRPQWAAKFRAKMRERKRKLSL